MGTSSLHYGTKRSPLLPDDFDDPGSGGSDSPLLPPEQLPDAPSQEGDSDNEYQPEISWGGAKRTMGRFASGNLNGGARKVASAYVKAAGGARNAKNASRSGIKTARNIISFFGGISSTNIRTTLQNNDIQYEGRSSSEVFDDIINVIAPTGSTREEAISRKAVIETFAELFSTDGFDIDSLDSFNGDTLKSMLQIYIGKYIYISIIDAMGYSILKNSSNNPDRVIRIETEMRDYIKSVVDMQFRDKSFSNVDRLSTNEITDITKDLFQHCFQVLEAQL